MNNFEHYIGHEGIYLERGCVLKVRLLSVKPIEFDGDHGADFQLEVLASYGSRAAPVDEVHSSAVNDLEVGSVYLDEHDAIITASGYILWKLIFNVELIEEIMLSITDYEDNRMRYRAVEALCTQYELEQYMKQKVSA